MYSLYKRIGMNAPVLIYETESSEEAKQYLVGELVRAGHLNKEQAFLLVEHWIPVQWTNGQFFEARQDGNNAVFETEDKTVAYTIMIGHSAQ